MQLLTLLLLIIGDDSLPPPATPQVAADSDLSFWSQLSEILALILALILAIAVPFLSRLVLWIKASLDRRLIMRRTGAKLHPGVLSNDSFRYFVEPTCHYIDPSSGEAILAADGSQQLFDILDEKFSHPEAYKYLMLLADSGIGKTTALINYYLLHARRLRKPSFDLALITLNLPDSDSLIKAIEDRANTVLMLDALDENTLGIADHIECLWHILKATSDFRCVLISCRPHFFSKDEEIPENTGIPKVGDRRAGQKPEYSLHKIHLLPFDNQQVKKYLRRRYPLWRRERKQAFEIITKIPQLAARPMLLAYTDDLLRSKKKFKYSYELYEEMVNAWLDRETKEQGSLRQFSELLAVNLYRNQERRKSETIPRVELIGLAKEWGVDMDDWKLSGRSLLSRNSVGNFKFADNSVLEYLFVCQFFRGAHQTLQIPWTDQMHLFFWERVMKQWEESNYPWFAPEPFRILLERPNGIDMLIRSHTVYAQRSDGRIPTETWDRFGVSLIANLLHMSGYVKPYVLFKRIKKISNSYNFGEQKIKFDFSNGAFCQYGEAKLFHRPSGPENLAIYNFELSEILLADGEATNELPQQVSNCFFTALDFWIRRAFMIRTRSGTDAILGFQTVTPVDDQLLEKIIRRAGILF